MIKPFLVIQLRPEDAVCDNEFATIKRFGGLGDGEAESLRVVGQAMPEIDLNRYSGIIVGGSPFEVSSPAAAKGETQRRIEAGFAALFDKLIPADFPFLGCCSGNGLLGHYLGATVSRRYGEAVGGADLRLTAAGRDDPLLRGLPESFRVLLGHKEACENTPPGSVLLADTATCPVQMFRVGANVYATQFHPEGDADGFRVRIEAYKDAGYFPPETANDLAAAIAREHTPHARAILLNFVGRYRRPR